MNPLNQCNQRTNIFYKNILTKESLIRFYTKSIEAKGKYRSFCNLLIFL